MTTLQHLRQTIADLVAGHRERRQLRRELAQLAALGQLDPVLADLGLARSQVEPLLAGCGDHELFDRMLERLGIDPATLPVEEVREMRWACTRCDDTRSCRHWLVDGDDGGFHRFCPNADALERAAAAGGAPPAAA